MVAFLAVMIRLDDTRLLLLLAAGRPGPVARQARAGIHQHGMARVTMDVLLYMPAVPLLRRLK
jgi:hypothetical protein